MNDISCYKWLLSICTINSERFLINQSFINSLVILFIQIWRSKIKVALTLINVLDANVSLFVFIGNKDTVRTRSIILLKCVIAKCLTQLTVSVVTNVGKAFSLWKPSFKWYVSEQTIVDSSKYISRTTLVSLSSVSWRMNNF